VLDEMPYRSIAGAVKERLMVEILFSDKYKPGEWINESVIAKELNVSKAPIREALRELAAIGIVEIVPHKGAKITQFSKEDMEEIYTIRYLLEERIFNDLISRDALSQDDINHLKRLVQEMKEIILLNTPEKPILGNFLLKDLEFHKYLWSKSNLKWTVKVLLDIYLLLILGMYNFLMDADLIKTYEYHVRIIDYLKAKDIEQFKKDRSESYYALRRH